LSRIFITHKFKQMIKKIVFFLFLILVSCKEANCTEISSKFTSYEDAIELVQNSSFAIEEKVNTDSSWIDSIEYYSCDEVSGYLIVNTKKGKSYIHKNVPVQVWNEFKNAESYGKYYNQNIKGNYYLVLN
jgi:hypothetical protein